MTNPKFGDRMRGTYASENNPLRDGMYVRTIRKTGKLNPGTYYELTDGHGKFWMYPAESTALIEVAHTELPDKEFEEKLNDLIEEVVDSASAPTGDNSHYFKAHDALTDFIDSAISRAVEEERGKQKWIPMDQYDHKIHGKHVLALTKNRSDDWQGPTIMYRRDGFWFMSGRNEEVIAFYRPLYFMPLPPEPQEVK